MLYIMILLFVVMCIVKYVIGWIVFKNEIENGLIWSVFFGLYVIFFVCGLCVKEWKLFLLNVWLYIGSFGSCFVVVFVINFVYCNILIFVIWLWW